MYLVDGACRIRWAGSGNATEWENEAFVAGLRRLLENKREVLEDGAAAEVGKEEGSIGAAG